MWIEYKRDSADQQKVIPLAAFRAWPAISLFFLTPLKRLGGRGRAAYRCLPCLRRLGTPPRPARRSRAWPRWKGSPAFTHSLLSTTAWHDMESVSQYQIRSRWAGGDTPPHFSHYAIAPSPPPSISSFTLTKPRVCACTHQHKVLLCIQYPCPGQARICTRKVKSHKAMVASAIIISIHNFQTRTNARSKSIKDACWLCAFMRLEDAEMTRQRDIKYSM
ncbi:hypothetical protein Naga_100106g14 [Nannochloropsis gaditana]|uniref:Uncharacterized protein n=1 Tax=Nannochloropsis gaditana TaxID=72520 RepID=W7UA67_9STRA|nr:hypothetical protein Naga_100106g14 [Nannochloropsis gaditana]